MSALSHQGEVYRHYRGVPYHRRRTVADLLHVPAIEPLMSPSLPFKQSTLVRYLALKGEYFLGVTLISTDPADEAKGRLGNRRLITLEAFSQDLAMTNILFVVFGGLLGGLLGALVDLDAKSKATN